MIQGFGCQGLGDGVLDVVPVLQVPPDLDDLRVEDVVDSIVL
jgi:hypothetical protein